MADVFIYALCEPDTGAVRWVGTSTNPMIRRGTHIADAKRNRGRNRAKNDWIMGLLARNLRPSLLVLESVPADSWQEAEQRWVTLYREQGAPLLNVLPGGSGRRVYGDILTEAFIRQRYIVEQKSLEAIGHEVGVSGKTVADYARRYHISVAPPGSAISLIDCSGFVNLVDDWHTYWLGFLAADGCVFIGKHNRFVRIALQASDADHIRNFQHGLKATGSVLIGANKYGGVASLNIYNQQLIDALAKWGVGPGKTLTMAWPAQLPPSLVPAYIRGYFDGDGTIYQRHRIASGRKWTETVCRFISGNVPFLEALQQELQRRGVETRSIYRNQQSNAFVLPLSSRRENLLAFVDLIYHDCTVCLGRKRALFRELESYHVAHARTGSHLRYQAHSVKGRGR